MADDVISVLTYKSADTILAVGGSQSWSLNRSRAKACTYAVLCRNANTRDAEDDIPHGTAFMVGRISDVVPSTDHDGRWLILFSEFATCSVPDQWDGRNPVTYWTTDDYDDINFEALDFQPVAETPPIQDRPSPGRSLTIAEAKVALGRTFGVQPSSVEITIRA